MTKERRLGRGLEALLGQLPGWNGNTAGGDPAAAGTVTAVPSPSPVSATSLAPAVPAAQVGIPAPPATVEPQAAPMGQQTLSVELIDHNPHQPRQEFDADEIKRLAESLDAHGLLQPVVVRRHATRFQVVAGERRLRAAKLAGWSNVPALIVVADERQMAELAIVENLQRKDLNALEKAASFQRYLQEFGCTQEELANRLKLDRSTIANLIRLLELPEAVQDSLRRGKITQGHARALLPLGEEREQVAMCERVQKEGLNVRQIESLVQEMIAQADGQPLNVIGRDGASTKPRRGSAENVAALEQEFRAALGVRVKISHDARGRGKVVIQFGNHEEFDRVRAYICGTERPSKSVQVG